MMNENEHSKNDILGEKNFFLNELKDNNEK